MGENAKESDHEKQQVAVMGLLMRQQIGFLLQFAVLVFLPMLMLWQLNFGIPLLVMPVLTLVAIMVFMVGDKLRKS